MLITREVSAFRVNKTLLDRDVNALCLDEKIIAYPIATVQRK